MKEDYRIIPKKQRRRIGRQIRQYRRLEKWLASEACEALNVVENFLYEWKSFPKQCTFVHQFPKALVHAVPVEQLKTYIKLGNWWEKNELFLEIQDIIRGIIITPHIENIMNDLKEKSKKRGQTLSEVTHDELYCSISKTFKTSKKSHPEWIKHAIFVRFYKTYLHPEVSTLNIPEIAPLMTAICCLGYVDQLIDFMRWDQLVKEVISLELLVEIPKKNELWREDKEVPISKFEWETIWRVTNKMLPNLYYYKANDQNDVEKMLSRQEIKKFINDFDLKPI